MLYSVLIEPFVNIDPSKTDKINPSKIPNTILASDVNTTPVRINYKWNPYYPAEGLLRGLQRFITILLSTKGSDGLDPEFGTYLPNATSMNTGGGSSLKTFVVEQINDAMNQFLIIQKSLKNTVTQDDLIKSIEIKDISTDPQTGTFIQLRVYTYTTDAIEVSLGV